MTEEQIRAVKQGDEDPMDLVLQGEATLIEFSHDHIRGQCGKIKRYLEQSSATDGGGWDNVADLIRWEDIENTLLSTYPVIVPGSMKDETVVAFIDQMQCALAAVARNRDEVNEDFDAVSEDVEE